MQEINLGVKKKLKTRGLKFLHRDDKAMNLAKMQLSFQDAKDLNLYSPKRKYLETGGL